MTQEVEQRGHNFGNARERFPYEFNGRLLPLTILQASTANGILSDNGATRTELFNRLKMLSESNGEQKSDAAVHSLVSNTLVSLRTIFGNHGYSISEQNVPNPNLTKNGKKRDQRLYKLIPQTETSTPPPPSSEPQKEKRAESPDSLASRKRRIALGYETALPIPPENISPGLDLASRLENALPSDRAAIKPLLNTSITNPISRQEWLQQLQGSIPKVRGFHLEGFIAAASELGISIREKKLPDGNTAYYRA